MSVIKERPILFNGAMVRAIREGRKTVTRRVMKPQPGVDQHGFMRWQHKGVLIAEQNAAWAPFEKGFPAAISDGLLWLCPYGKPGDRLWVRETFAVYGDQEFAAIHYRADRPHDVGLPGRGYKPSIHMPRWVCRILLEITAVRVERLRDISGDQALAEGIYSNPKANGMYTADGDFHTSNRSGPVEAFAHLWESTGGDWDANPWVWVVEFKRIEQ